MNKNDSILSSNVEELMEEATAENEVFHNQYSLAVSDMKKFAKLEPHEASKRMKILYYVMFMQGMWEGENKALSIIAKN